MGWLSFHFQKRLLKNDKACTKYTFTAREMTLKWPGSPWLVSGRKRWQVSFMTGHGVESIVHFVNWSGMVWHPIWECLEFKTWNSEAALCSIECFNMSRKLGVELCNPVTAFCVKFNCDDGKKRWHTIFPVLKKSIFVYSVFFFLWKIFNCTFYFTNSCIFHRENMVLIFLSILHCFQYTLCRSMSFAL